MESLPKAINERKISFAKRLNTTGSQWRTVIERGDITVVKFVSILNLAHVCSSSFISEKPVDKLKVIPAKDWKPILVNLRRLSDRLTKDRGLCISKVCKELGISTARWYRMMAVKNSKRENLEDSNLRMSFFLNLCNRFDINPFEIIIDRNDSDTATATLFDGVEDEYENIPEGFVPYSEYIKLSKKVERLELDIAALKSLIASQADAYSIINNFLRSNSDNNDDNNNNVNSIFSPVNDFLNGNIDDYD